MKLTEPVRFIRWCWQKGMTFALGYWRDFEMHIEGLRSPYAQVGGLVFLGRMLDKIRLHAAGRLPADYHRGGGMDARICTFFKLDYERIVAVALSEPDDLRALERCWEQGRRPTEDAASKRPPRVDG